jgi:hypothetical protein
MVGQRLLLGATLFAALLPVVISVPESVTTTATCTTGEALAGTCSTGTISGDHVDLGASSGGGFGLGANDSGSSSARDDEESGDEELPPTTTGTTCKGVGKCNFDLGDTGIQVTGTTLAMSDLASFYPQRPTVASEPDGWAIIGLDTNFVSSAAQHTASGILLGRPASVRFTPVSFLWDYGDGVRASTASGGRTWKQWGVPEFSPTPTSHIYSAGGSYDVRLTVEYTAQYSIASGPWLGVPGTLRLSAPTFTVVAADAKTVLVQRNCQADPQGPGC